MADNPVWQSYACLLHSLIYMLIGLSTVRTNYIKRLKESWPWWFSHVALFVIGTVVVHVLWAAAFYFVWNAEDPDLGISPGTWDADQAFLILCFAASLPIVYMIATLLFWRFRQIALGTFMHGVVFIIILVPLILCIVRNYPWLSIAFYIATLIWQIVLVVAGVVISMCSPRGPVFMACDSLMQPEAVEVVRNDYTSVPSYNPVANGGFVMASIGSQSGAKRFTNAAAKTHHH